MRSLALALFAFVALAAGTTANADKAKFNAADQAAARRAVLRATDLGGGWKSSTTKPRVPISNAQCSAKHLKAPHVIVTGTAQTAYHVDVAEVDSEVTVFQHASMAADEVSLAATPGFLTCVRTTEQKGLGTTGSVIAVQRLPYFQMPGHTSALRIVTDVDVKGRAKRARVVIDILLFTKARTELVLEVTALDGARAAMRTAEYRLARIMSRRATAS